MDPLCVSRTSLSCTSKEIDFKNRQNDGGTGRPPRHLFTLLFLCSSSRESHSKSFSSKEDETRGTSSVVTDTSLCSFRRIRNIRTTPSHTSRRHGLSGPKLTVESVKDEYTGPCSTDGEDSVLKEQIFYAYFHANQPSSFTLLDSSRV